MEEEDERGKINRRDMNKIKWKCERSGQINEGVTNIRFIKWKRMREEGKAETI